VLYYPPMLDTLAKKKQTDIFDVYLVIGRQLCTVI